MTYPTSTDLQTLDYAFAAQPFVQVLGSGAATTGLDLAQAAQPFSGTDYVAPAGPSGPSVVIMTSMFLVF